MKKKGTEKSTRPQKISKNKTRKRRQNGGEGLNGPDVGIHTSSDGHSVEYFKGYFNNNKHVRESHNCYTYFLNLLNQEAVDKCKKDFGKYNICRRSQPGYYSGHNYLNKSDYKCPIIMKRTLDDNKNIIPLYGSDVEKPCPPGFYKGALVVAPGRDYHYYRQDDDLGGKWSHKPGFKPSTRKDSKGDEIYDPKHAARDYGDTLNYTDFCGYMCVPRNNKKKFMAHKGSVFEFKNRNNHSHYKVYGGKTLRKKRRKKKPTRNNKKN